MNKRYRVFYTQNGMKKASGNFNSFEVADAYAKRIIKVGMTKHAEVMVEV